MKRVLPFLALGLFVVSGCQKNDDVAVNTDGRTYEYDNYQPREQWRMRSYPYSNPRQEQERLFETTPRKPLQTTPSRLRNGPFKSTPPTPYVPPPHMPPQPMRPPPAPTPNPPPMTQKDGDLLDQTIPVADPT